MKNWVVKLLLLLFIPSLAGILFTVALGFNPGGWLQITTYALPPLLTLAGGAFIVASRWKIPFLILMAAASMAFNMLHICCTNKYYSVNQKLTLCFLINR